MCSSDLDHTIKSGGENVHPSEVENILFDHPDVADAAVVGLSDRHWGQVVAAAIVCRDGDLTEAVLDSYCKESQTLANFKRPRRYVFVDTIPASPTGKVDKERVQQLFD